MMDRDRNAKALPPVEQLFQQGIELFNQGLFFECHEAWEQAWLRSKGEEKLFYQGLIQAAVAILHAQRGNLAGSRTLWAKARTKLAPLPAGYKTIALDELRRRLEDFFNYVLRGDAPNRPPTITTLA
jgi:predicted metal-dependent hydrolase